LLCTLSESSGHAKEPKSKALRFAQVGELSQQIVRLKHFVRGIVVVRASELFRCW